MARRLEWHVNGACWANTPSTLVSGNAANFQLISGTEVEGRYQGGLVVERVIGQVALYNLSDQPFEPASTVHMRLRTGLEDLGTNVVGTAGDDLEDADVAEEEFMLHRVFTAQSGIARSMLDAELANPWWSIIDCKVNRRLESAEALVLTYWISSIPADVEWSIQHWLRVLVRPLA